MEDITDKSSWSPEGSSQRAYDVESSSNREKETVNQILFILPDGNKIVKRKCGYYLSCNFDHMLPMNLTCLLRILPWNYGTRNFKNICH
eukprot:TRINITY_DN4670_c0_g2_i1.p2 TRINITY_DN4670_c0_g2~~TRINITY_DN4670_c0_g2_i1.p2  ORF type:complete len:89 (+),score=13.49 TRINITY_DN4670_c0_g2_i1:168-434(+)